MKVTASQHKPKRGYLFGLSCILLCSAFLTACAEDPVYTPVSVEISPELTTKWANSCALCHVNGEALAPRIGNAQEWHTRIQQGTDTLLTHTLDGYNAMPPLGYCMSCSRADFVALIEFMAGTKLGVPQ